MERSKARAAHAALAHVRSGMLVGLGSGSTAFHMIIELGRRLTEGELQDVRGVATSLATEKLALASHVPVVDLPAAGVDVAIDGMDEVTTSLDAIKGLGGALTREKIVAESARRFLLIGDRSKRVEALGQLSPVPIEALAFGWRRTAERLRDLGAEPIVRHIGREVVRTDNGHLVIDCRMPAGFDARRFAQDVDAIPGVLGHGLFLGLAERAFLADPQEVQELVRAPVGDETDVVTGRGGTGRPPP
jgi:ribose 5-phosphate isomerase A